MAGPASTGSDPRKGMSARPVAASTRAYSPAGIKRFVRHTLGCTCSDEVFERIEQGVSQEGSTGLPVVYRILIGARLLVYLWTPADGNSLESGLPGVVERGRTERDTHGYNRFRLVILARAPEALEQRAGELFRTAAGNDDCLHLHCVDSAEAGDVLYS